jgi:hypothetical protein
VRWFNQWHFKRKHVYFEINWERVSGQVGVCLMSSIRTLVCRVDLARACRNTKRNHFLCSRAPLLWKVWLRSGWKGRFVISSHDLLCYQAYSPFRLQTDRNCKDAHVIYNPDIYRSRKSLTYEILPQIEITFSMQSLFSITVAVKKLKQFVKRVENTFKSLKLILFLCCLRCVVDMGNVADVSEAYVASVLKVNLTDEGILYLQKSAT